MRFLPTLFLFTFLLSSLTTSAQIEGNWYAILNAMETKIPTGLEISNTDGGFSAIMTSPSQTNTKIPATVTFDGQKISLKITMVGATFDGVLDGKQMKGIFSQAGQDFPMTFHRHRPEGYPIQEGPITITRRQQEPTDFPYERIAVNYPGGAEGVTMAGELTLPSKGKPKALIVLVSGSGPQDRNAYLGSQINHSPFLILSDYLTRQGYGVLRYDDRGVAESTGEFRTATSDDFALDALAAVQYLRTREELKGVAIGVAGHSEGGMIAPVVASRDEALDFVILLAAPAVSIDSLMLEQRRQVGLAMGQPEVLIRRDEPALRAAYAWIKDNPELSQEDYVAGLYEVFEAQLKHLPAALQKSIVDPKAFNAQYVIPLSDPWMRRFIAFEPQDFLQSLTIPVLAINGLKDTQVDGLMNLNAISQAMAISGNKDVTVVPMLGLNHLFQPADTGAPTEYGTIETTFDPSALETIGAWLKKRY
ncbi:alpha/beta hydrolase family protein [Neolewinella persica]|uniref:alpha/beta hydrolase family protein n=1 Tax=Neolewinella persica TaxID=70998 RepID=UPI000377BCA9|nr:alpha/beta hydrolase [Neolewinella persica]